MNDFWEFSLNVYARPGVEQACLALQEQAGADVNLLLFSLWLATQRRQVNWATLLVETGLQTRQARVKTLRQQRLAQRSALKYHSSAAYEQLKAEELAAEQEEQAWLFAVYQSYSAAESGMQERVLAKANLTAYLAALKLEAPAEGLQALLMAFDSGY